MPLRLLFILIFKITSTLISAQAVTLLNSGDLWSYQEGNPGIFNNWMMQGYDDSVWEVGNGGIGYGDDDDSTLLTDAQSVYMRQEFTLFNLEEITELSLFASFDDGFVAYLNGVEISRSNLEGEFPSYSTTAPSYKEPEIPQGLRPVEFKINQEILDHILVEGSNLLAVQTHNFGDNSSDLSSNYWLIGNHIGADNPYSPLPDWYSAESFDSQLPIILITSTEAIVDEPKINATIKVIHDPSNLPNNSIGGKVDYFGNIAIEKRGESSLFFFPKNGYGFETRDSLWEDLDVELLGFPEEEDWILHGPYSDKTFLRNLLVMDIARQMGQYSSRTQPVELIINESYQGIYILMERIKRDKNRVDIANLKDVDTTGVELTGGYVFKVDKGEPDWVSRYGQSGNPSQKLGFQYVSPKANQIQSQQALYIQSYVDSMEMALKHPSLSFGGKTIEEYIDLETFVDHYIISELTRNVDAFRISTYLHKEKDTDGGLIKMGPVWDYNIALGNADYCDAWLTNGLVLYNDCSGENPFWWYELMDYLPFKNLLKCRYQDHRASILQNGRLDQFIESQISLIGDQSRQRDDTQWNVIGNSVWPNFFVGQTYRQDVDYLKNFIFDRLEFLDTVWGDDCLISGTNEDLKDNRLTISPNPTTDYFTLQNATQCGNCTLVVSDITGKQYYSQPLNNHYKTVNVRSFVSGIYIVSIRDANGQVFGRSKLVVE